MAKETGAICLIFCRRIIRLLLTCNSNYCYI